MLVVPFAWDQPDHADRVTRMGVGLAIARDHYTPRRVAEELRRLLDNPAYAHRAAAIGEKVRAEDGVQVACDALEELLSRKRL